MARKTDKEIMKKEPERGPSPFAEMERWFDESFRRPFGLWRSAWLPRMWDIGNGDFTPNVDIYEEKDNITVTAELPGMTKDDISVDISDDLVTISGEKKHEGKTEKDDYFRIERSFGTFRRSFRLPKEVIADKAKATFRDGILELKIPKTDEAKRKKKKIPIE
jgi:HSP20 family protein